MRRATEFSSRPAYPGLDASRPPERGEARPRIDRGAKCEFEGAGAAEKSSPLAGFVLE